MTGVMVRERLNQEAGILLVDRLGGLVAQADPRGGLGAFFLDDRAARVALAGAVRVVLADGDDAGVRMLAHPREGALDQLAAHLRIREAQLCAALALSADLREPLG